MPMTSGVLCSETAQVLCDAPCRQALPCIPGVLHVRPAKKLQLGTRKPYLSRITPSVRGRTTVEPGGDGVVAYTLAGCEQFTIQGMLMQVPGMVWYGMV